MACCWPWTRTPAPDTKLEQITKALEEEEEDWECVDAHAQSPRETLNKNMLAIDLSLNSPGIVVKHETGYSAYFFPTRKRDRGFCKEQDGFSLQALPPLESKELYHRYDLVVRAIMDAAARHGVKRAVLEGYSFGSQSSSVSKLYELGGILRHALWKAGIPFEEHAPATVKKCFAGSGRADKLQMWAAFREKGFPDLLAMMGLVAGKDVPHPVQDVVDSVALLESHSYSFLPRK